MYPAHLDRLHSLWDRHASTPADLAAALPGPGDWAEFLESWSLEVDTSLELTRAGQVRRATLTADAAAVRAFAVRILNEFGALERTSRPAPPPPPKEDGGANGGEGGGKQRRRG